nr:penicillin-binding transpeptidase domain-containing protein [bacterium]
MADMPTTKRKNVRLVLTLVVLFLASFTLSAMQRGAGSNAPTSPDDVGTRYLKAWQAGDYERMYRYLSTAAQQAYTQEKFAVIHENYYQAMKLQDMSLVATQSVYSQELACWVQGYNMAFTLMGAGDMSIENQAMKLVNEGEKEEDWRVDFALDMILPRLSQGDYVRLVSISPMRGEIFSQDGIVLARNEKAQSVYAVPEKIQDVAGFCLQLGSLIGMTEESVRTKVESKEAARDGYIVLRAYPAGTLPDEVKDAINAIDGAGVDSRVYTTVRSYPNGSLLSHTLGYVGSISEDQLPQYQQLGYTSDDKVGKMGLEYSFESTMRGSIGWRLERLNSEDEVQEDYLNIPVQKGNDLWLTIDTQLQKRAEELLKTKLDESQRGVIIVLEPTTGKVNAMASYPDYDPNIFSWPINQETWGRLNNDPDKPLFSRATNGLYPPGSSFKPFVAAWALESGQITADTAFTGEVVDSKWTPDMDNWVYPPITRLLYVPSPVNLENAIIYSDNIYFAWLALGMGAERFVENVQALGIGEAFDADVSVTKGRISNLLPIVNLRQLADSGYGQGELVVTPLQMAATFSAFANGGNIMKPQLVEKIGHQEGLSYVYDQVFEPVVWRENVISKAAIDIIQPDMHKVCTQGTAWSIGMSNISGKTGTAELDNDKSRIIAWFCGYIDDGSMDRLVLVMIEAKTKGGGIRYELAREMFKP